MNQAANSLRTAHVALKSTDKLKLLDDLRRGVNQTAASKKYGIDRSTVSKIKRKTRLKLEAMLRELNNLTGNALDKAGRRCRNRIIMLVLRDAR